MIIAHHSRCFDHEQETETQKHRQMILYAMALSQVPNYFVTLACNVGCRGRKAYYHFSKIRNAHKKTNEMFSF